MNWDYENITKVGEPHLEQSPIAIDDKIFNKSKQVFNNSFSLSQDIKIIGTIPPSAKITLRGFASKNDEFLPIDDTKRVALDGGEVQNNRIKLSSIDLQRPAASCGDTGIEHGSILSIFLKGIAGGFIALFMPCLFPMLPITVSLFANRSGSRAKAVRYGIFYGLSIMTVYLLASVPFHFLSGVSAHLFNTIATNAWVNIAFFIIFFICIVTIWLI